VGKIDESLRLRRAKVGENFVVSRFTDEGFDFIDEIILRRSRS